MTQLLPLVEAAANSQFGGAVSWRFFVPGRLEVFGKHTDYAGGRTLVAAVPRGFVVCAQPADDGQIVAVDARTNDSFAAPADRHCAAPERWPRYVATVVRRLASNFPDRPLSTRIAFASNLPSSAGISSSSALVVAIAEAVIARAGIQDTPAWRENVASPEDRAAYFGCLENGASFKALAGDAGVGTHGGSEDHAAIVLSESGHLQQLSFVPLRLERRVPLPRDWTFVVGSTGVRASKTGGARARYNRLADTIHDILSMWRARHPDDRRSLADVARAGDLRALSLGEEHARRLEHFVAEDARVPLAADAFARGDIAAVGRLADASHEAAATLLGNQVRETNAMVRLARTNGAAAASAFGAGWGGSVWALVRTAAAEGFLDTWLRNYRKRFPHRSAEGFIALPSAGLRSLGP